MTILGVSSDGREASMHDPSVALIIDNEIVYGIEQERLSRNRYAIGEGVTDAVKACFQATGIHLSDIDYITHCWHEDLQLSTKLSDEVLVSDELTQYFLPQEIFGYKKPPPIHYIQHHLTHAAATYYTSGFDSAAILVVDGRGEGESISLYHAKGNKIELIQSYPIIYSLGMLYATAGTYAGIGGKLGLSGPGKLMGLAPFGQVREELMFSFNEDTGLFTLPPFIQQKVDALPPSPTSGPLPLIGHKMWGFWYEHFEQVFYPYQGQKNGLSTAYDIMHYVDFAASIQHTLEQICLSLAKRIKKLTGEKNLVLGGGCALNCSMNAYLSKQKLFENIYVFPGANDSGSTIGAALALSYILNPSAPKKPRLVAPDFGNDYTENEIIVAFTDYGFTPHKLSPDELAEQVANDLANNKIIAWFQGRDEFGPRALGRRSFMANPTHRENLGRLNKIKGREMWRPLAPSILDEQAETVLEGSMERGLHRYMLGVATIRNEWRSKIPAVLHIDFTCRPHFVQQEHDGAYWAVINKFYEKTGIPLVCNTSLNVAGQPIVHKPEEVLEVFATRDDVQTLVIEGFYLTKDKSSKTTESKRILETRPL